jgi:hypothetical protein
MLGHTIEPDSGEPSDFRRRPRKRSPFLTIALLTFVLLAWVSTAPAQISSSASSTPKPESTVSVRELQIPAKARNSLLRGVERLRKGDTAGSLVYFNRAIQQAPDYLGGYYHKAWQRSGLTRRTRRSSPFNKPLISAAATAPWRTSATAKLWPSWEGWKMRKRSCAEVCKRTPPCPKAMSRLPWCYSGNTSPQPLCLKKGAGQVFPLPCRRRMLTEGCSRP